MFNRLTKLEGMPGNLFENMPENQIKESGHVWSKSEKGVAFVPEPSHMAYKKDP